MRTILVWLQDGGPFIVPLLLVGVASVGLLVERLVHIVIRSKIHARPFMERVISLARNDKLDEALTLCADHEGALADLGLVILRGERGDEADLTSVARSATVTMTPELKRRLAWLPPLGTVAVLLGVAGGVVNLHQAILQSTPLSEGIAYALRPLGVGLLLAIPIVVGHALLVSESQKLAAQLDEFAMRLINALVDRPDVRLGHRN